MRSSSKRTPGSLHGLDGIGNFAASGRTDMHETLLIIHILSAAAWIGGTFFLGFAGPRMGRAGGPAAGAWIGLVLQAVPRFFLPVSLLTLASGLLIVTNEEQWNWSDPFVGIGIAAVVIALSIAFLNNVPTLKAMIEAANSGDLPGVAARARKVTNGGLGIALTLIGAEVVMVLRLGAG